MSNESPQTLGQKIDAVLQPLYDEAEQHRATIALVTEQQQSLQEQLDSATQGLKQIESRMAQVVRSLADQEPVIAAVVGEHAEPTEQATPTEPVAAIPEAEPESESESVSEPEQVVAALALTEEVAPEPASAEPVAETQPVEEASTEPEEATIQLDPIADAQTVDEAAALLGETPAEPEPEPEPEPAPAVDLAAAAERASAAAKQLRDKAAAK